jgi:hypothetical protein
MKIAYSLRNFKKDSSELKKAKIFNEDQKVKPMMTRGTTFGPPKRGLSAILSLSRK